MEYASKFFIANLPDFTDYILNLCAEVKKYGRDDYRDGQILANAIIFAFWTGLRASEFLNLQNKDVKCQGTGEIADSIRIGNEEIEICDDIKNLIQGHLTYLESAGYKTTRAQPLFPKTRKSSRKNRSDDKNLSYVEDTMTSHIRACLKGTRFSFQRFESIRKESICSYFVRLKESGEFSPDECLVETTCFARYRDQKETIRIIKGFMQPEDEDGASIYDDIPKLSLLPFIDKTWILPYLQYKYCIKYFHGIITDKNQLIIPYGIVLDISVLSKIKNKFFLSLDLHPELTTIQKDSLKEYFMDIVKERYNIDFQKPITEEESQDYIIDAN